MFKTHSTTLSQRAHFSRVVLCTALMLMSVLVSACSLDANLSRIELETMEPRQKVFDRELVPVSQQGVLTSGGFRVQSSVSYFNGVDEVITVQGYKIHSGVQSILYESN